jgi:hypothetical protein
VRIACAVMTLRSRRAVLGTFVLAALAVALAALVGAGSGGASATWQFGPFAGYAWRGSVVSVRASWTVPGVIGGSSPSSVAGTWIGAAASNRSFIQIGTNERGAPLIEAGKPDRGRYEAFWSDPKWGFHPLFIFRVNPGDDVSASLSLSHKRWMLAIVDATSGAAAHFSTGDETHASFSEAQWMQEDVKDGATGKPFPYPGLTTVGFRRLTVNSGIPTYAKLYSAWMSVNGSSLAPTPLQDDSFTLGRGTVSAAGARYLHIATPEDVATETFVAEFARWTAKTPYSQVESASSRFVAALRRNTQAFASDRWPTELRGLVRSLIADSRVLLEVSRPPAIVSPAELVTWRSRWARDAQALGSVAHMIKSGLNLPEIRPVT